jgi:pyridoxine 5-phosphate synthase
VVRLSVNVNKVATVRNSRGGRVPSVIDAARVVVESGAQGVTVHPRADERHITRADTLELARVFAGQFGAALEYNIEGDPRPDWLDLVCEAKPQQATLVPVTPGEVTSHAGWVPGEHETLLRAAVKRVKASGIRVSVFVDPELGAIDWAKDVGADRVELYTEPFARAYDQGDGNRSFDDYVCAAEHAHSLGLGINAGHDLDLENLVLFRTLPHLDEVSIGHAIVSRAIFHGLAHVVREYLSVLAGAET